MCGDRRRFLAPGAAFLSVAAEAELLEGGPQAHGLAHAYRL